MRISLNRTQVEEALADRNTTLPAFIEERLDAGKSMEDIWLELRNLTGVPFSTRTLYRWADSLEKAS